MENEIPVWWPLLALIPFVCFALGWFAARIDMKTVLKQAKTLPAAFYSALEALVDRNSGKAARELAEAAEAQPQAYGLNLTLAKLYRSRGENDKAAHLLQKLAESPDTVGGKKEAVQFELGLTYQSAGLVDRAEQIFLSLENGNMAKGARERLLNIYQQDRDWEKAVAAAQVLSHDEQTYRFETAQFYCEMAQAALFKSDFAAARAHVRAALDANRKCSRANIILGDIEQKEGRPQAAVEAYTAVEKQNHAYLGMAGERLYDAYDAQNRAAEGLDILIGYMKTFPQLDLLDVVYEKSLLLYGEQKANETIAELVRTKPDLNGVYRLLGVQIAGLSPVLKADADMMRAVVGQHLQKSRVYRCRNCHFKSQAFFWHCPACNKWETFTPNRIEV
ncbi:tetratricopeptide repeat protein [Kingella potus]|uniref:Tetratricopeptide repeat protein n=1 Tax=Kingella potus TaxID=265175 RepID=A0A377QZB9_9NEIS|nr:lipopolysaccharide assembly protein LapB [Kingella potus]STR00209.1 tetratricopeptide repeat protein [Kingella potus]